METTRSSEVLRYMRDVLGKRTSVTEEEGAESGFTLIELMVVLLIMAILLAIAIPTFLGVKSGAQDRAAQSNLTTALTSAKAAYANAQVYGAASGSTSITSTLNSQEPEMKFVTGPTSAVGTLSVATGDPSGASAATNQTLMLVAFSAANFWDLLGSCGQRVRWHRRGYRSCLGRDVPELEGHVLPGNWYSGI